MSNILFYSDANCRTQISGGSVTGVSDGTCTQFGISSFGSFAVRSLGTGCVVTVYGNDQPYCSSSRLEIAALGQCVSNSTINQFSVDGCKDTSAAAPVVSSQSASASGSTSASASTARSSLSTATTTATGANGSVSVLTVSVTATAMVTPSASNRPADSVASEGLSAGAKAGTGIGIALGVIALFAVAIFLILRRKKKQKVPPVSFDGKETETGSAIGVAPAYSSHDEKRAGTGADVSRRHELSPEGRPLAELPQDQNSGLAEAPGDHSWATPQEMDTGRERSGLMGSTPSSRTK